MPRFRRRYGHLPLYIDDDVCVCTEEYAKFTFLRFIFRFAACYVDCFMMKLVLDSRHPPNPEWFQFNTKCLMYATITCSFCWLMKFFIACIEYCGCSCIETISDVFSFITLWIGDVPKNGSHLAIVCMHTQRFHRDEPLALIILAILKLFERFWGMGNKYDWRDDVWSEKFTIWYIFGIILETILSLISIALAFWHEDF